MWRERSNSCGAYYLRCEPIWEQAGLARERMMKIMSLQRRRERYSIIQVWKIFNGLSPNCTNMKFDNSDRLGVREKLPSFNHKAQTSVSSAYDSSFGVFSPKVWTQLHTWDCLGRIPRPVSGPTTGPGIHHSNSLLAWSTVGGIRGSAWRWRLMQTLPKKLKCTKIYVYLIDWWISGTRKIEENK